VLVAVSLVACRETPPPAEAPPQASPDQSSPGRDPWAAARARGIEFRAVGQEPGWYLEIDNGKSIHVVYDYGEREATMPVPPPVSSGDSITYEASTDARRLRVVIEKRPCSDIMSGLPFPSTVTVTIDGNTYRGCGQDL